MYEGALGKDLDEKARFLLKSNGEGLPVADLITDLQAVINYNDWRYYVHDDPALADQEYDRLFALLKKLELENPGLISPDSPTQRVAKGLNDNFPTVNHLVPMLSLANSYNAEDLREWDERNRGLANGQKITYCVEPKFDGAGISLIYEKDLLTRGATRGDGVQGDDITTNIRQIRSIPLSAKLSGLNIAQMEIRGEAIINKDSFNKLNEQRLKEGLPLLANPRNAASGSLRMIDPHVVGKRNLEVFLYHVSFLEMSGETPPELKTQYGILRALSQIGFRTPVSLIRLFENIDEVIQYCKEFEEKRDTLPFEIDGLVIKVNNFETQDLLGMTSHHPRWAMAYKFKARQASSKLRRVEFQVGRTGSVTPVAKIDPVPISGATISSVSLFNEDLIREKDIRIGDTVLVERAGDVIPYIVKPLSDLRDGTEQAIQFPQNCPVCGDKLVREQEESAWRCVNINCRAQVVERLIHFSSKDAMDIRNLGEANIKRFFDLGLLEDIPGIYQLDFGKIAQLEGFGKKSIDNLKEAIDQSRKQPLNRLIYALGIRFVGESTAKTLANAVHHLNDLKSMPEETLLTLEDIGPKVAGSIRQFFENPDNIHMLEALEALGLNMTSQKNRTAGGLSGKSFLFTGTLTMKREEAKEMVEAKGGKIMSGVSSKLDYLVIGEKAGSKLDKAKKINTVSILNEEEFLRLIQEV